MTNLEGVCEGTGVVNSEKKKKRRDQFLNESLIDQNVFLQLTKETDS